MGCHNSKQALRDLPRSPSPLPRSNSMPHQDHVVSLTSSTLGTLNLDAREDTKQTTDDGRTRDLSFELAKARAWSAMIDRKIPRTPTETPPNEPESIDALKLMAGLEGDSSPLNRHSFSFYPIPKSIPDSKLGNRNSIAKSKFDLVHESMPNSEFSNGDPNAESDFDPVIISTFRTAGSSRAREGSFESIGIVRARINAFQERIDSKKANVNAENGKKVVLYFTSLRGVRKTYDDCCSVRAILREYGVWVDERDVSMHGGFREELKKIIVGEGGWLPRVFVDGRDLGGEEEIRRMHEGGELGKVFAEWEVDLGGKGGRGEECEGCGDIRFVPCGRCSGSCRVYVEEGGGGGGWWRCSECNENGIVRCPVCC